MSLRFWGVRGSIPAPGAVTTKYGGNTPCIEVRYADTRLIFDMGTGARALGESMTTPSSATIFISHYHYDHLQGVPFFTPLFNPQNRFTIYGPTRQNVGVADAISGQMLQPYFPVSADAVFRAQLAYAEAVGGHVYSFGPVTVTTAEVNHPGGNLAYRIEAGGRAVVYATDVECGTPKDAELAKLAINSDALICDAMYTNDEYAGRIGIKKVGWGHSTFDQAVELADRVNTKQLVLFHHDPTRTDRQLDSLVAKLQRRRPRTIAAREGMVLRFPARRQ